MNKVYIKDQQDNKVLPYTHVSAVLDDEGNDLSSHLGAFEDEVRGLVETPHQEYVTVATYSALPASGSEDTIYRVSSWDGSANSGAGAVDVTVYSEYAWNGSDYVFLCVKSQIDEVFDITVYNSNTKYADLSAALGVNGVNIPESLRKGGMSVKYVQSSDNKYVQARCIPNEFTIDVTKWAIGEDEVLIEDNDFIYVERDSRGGIIWAVKNDGTIYYGVGIPLQVKEYVQQKIERYIEELGLVQNVNDIIAFLGNLISGDKTLQQLLNEKVDKEEGKGIIPLQFAQELEDEEDRLEIVTDSNRRIVAFRSKDGILHEIVGLKTKSITADEVYIKNSSMGDESVVLEIASYNTGDFSGSGIVTPSDVGKAAYRNSISLTNANILMSQEDVPFYGPQKEGETLHGETEGENPRTAIFGMYKNYYRKGNKLYNYKSFLSDYDVEDIEQVYYEKPQSQELNFSHPWYLKGIVNLQGKSIVIISIHLDWRDVDVRREQISQLIDNNSNFDYVIICGDLNHDTKVNGETDPTLDITTVRREELDMFVNAGYVLANGGYFGDFVTYHAGKYLDNVIVKGGKIRKVSTIVESYMNDHYPICATVVL